MSFFRFIALIAVLLLCAKVSLFSSEIFVSDTNNHTSNIAEFKRVAISYTPDSMKISLSNKIESNVIRKAFDENYEEAKKFMLLILLKQYLFYLNCCKESFNLWDELVGPSETVIVYEFLILSGHLKNRSYIETNQVYYYVLRDPVLKENYYLLPVIIEIQKKIQELEKQIKYEDPEDEE